MDTIANMLVAIKNAGNAKKQNLTVPFSNLNAAIAKALFDQGYIASYEKRERKVGGNLLLIGLKYTEAGSHRIHDVSRVSKPSRRVYAGVGDLSMVRQGHGHRFLSTPKGILSNVDAARQHVGGEVLFEIW
jgi:small subunit ribosomal protein S8